MAVRYLRMCFSTPPYPLALAFPPILLQIRPLPRHPDHPTDLLSAHRCCLQYHDLPLHTAGTASASETWYIRASSGLSSRRLLRSCKGGNDIHPWAFHVDLQSDSGHHEPRGSRMYTPKLKLLQLSQKRDRRPPSNSSRGHAPPPRYLRRWLQRRAPRQDPKAAWR